MGSPNGRRLGDGSSRRPWRSTRTGADEATPSLSRTTPSENETSKPPAPALAARPPRVPTDPGRAPALPFAAGAVVDIAGSALSDVVVLARADRRIVVDGT